MQISKNIDVLAGRTFHGKDSNRSFYLKVRVKASKNPVVLFTFRP